MTDGLLADQNLRLAQKMLDQQAEIAALKAQLAKVRALTARGAQCDETCTTDCGHCKGVGPLVVIAKVRALIDGCDPHHDVPADGSMLLATYSGGYNREHLPPREQVWVRSDQEDCTDPEGDWFTIPSDGGRWSYGVVLAHDDPACDRPTVTLEPLLFAYEVARALGGK